ncbi:MAG TPA: serine hydrolase domain-containing protein [Acidimicrobiales bacterium]|nr:serine hydrolase domain-containing protein [Acidimicrobiales bacterium]
MPIRAQRLLLAVLLAVAAVACSADDDGAADGATSSASTADGSEDGGASEAEDLCDRAEEVVDELNPIVGEAGAEDQVADLRNDAVELIDEAAALDVEGEAAADLSECVADLEDVISASEVSGRRPSAFPGARFPIGLPEHHGLTRAGVQALDGLAGSSGSNCVAVVHDGVLVHEHYWNGTGVETRQEIFSATKSITAFLVGIAVGDGSLELDDPVAEHVPAWRGTASEAVTVENLLSNDSGRQYDFSTDYLGMAVRAPDKTGFAIGLRQEDPPGTTWAYNNSAIQVLEQVLESATGQDMGEFAQERLFGPLGMGSHINRDAAGNTLAFMGGRASCQDLARFGLLALNEGRWEGQQIVPADFVRAATSPSQDLNTSYGYLWWLNTAGRRIIGLDGAEDRVIDDGTLAWPAAPPDTYAAQGLGGQLVVVIPSRGLVITRLASAGHELDTNALVGALLAP